MLQLKKPTVEQRKFIVKKGLDPAVWMVERDTPEKMVLVHRHSSITKRTIYKEQKYED